MSKAIIYTGGGAPSTLPGNLMSPGDFVIAADSGYDVARHLGMKVDLCIGDFDSTSFFHEIQGGRYEQSAKDKDESDTELAIQRAIGLGYKEYVLIGGGGHRLDHLLSTYSLFDLYAPPKLWLTAYESMHLVTGYQRFEPNESGLTVSFMPGTLSSSVVVTAKQLQWPLESFPLSISNVSLSNRTTDVFLDVFVKQSGRIFVSFPVADRLR